MMQRCTTPLRLIPLALAALALMPPSRAAADDNTVTITNKTSHNLFVADGYIKDDSVDNFTDPNSYDESHGWKKLAPGDTLTTTYNHYLVAAVIQGKINPIPIERLQNGDLSPVKTDGYWFGVVTDKFEVKLGDASPEGIRKAGYIPMHFTLLTPGEYVVGGSAKSAQAVADLFHDPSVVDPLKNKTAQRDYWRYAKGHFENTTANAWTEKNPDGAFDFQETGRNDDYVELYDAARDCTVRLYNDRCLVKANFTNNEFKKFYDGKWVTK